MPLKKKITKFIEYLVVAFIIFLCKLLPYKIREKITIRLALLLSKILKKKKQVIRNNIKAAFPDASDDWINEIEHKNILNLGKFIAEFIDISAYSRRNLENLIVSPLSKKEVIAMAQNGGVVILGHIGNWELTGSIVARWVPGQIFALAKRQSNPWTDRMIEKMRKMGGVESIYTDRGIYHYKKILEDKKILCILADQDAGKHGKFFQFLNRPASTFMGPAMLARITGCKIYYASSWHENGKFGFNFEVLDVPGIDPKKNPREWEMKLTETWVALLEKSVKDHPDDYFWAHNRWKTQPSKV